MKVTQLFIHPVKSCRGIAVNGFDVESIGPKWDRRWMLVDEKGRFLTQRKHARMTLLKTAMKGDTVMVSVANDDVAPEMNSIQFSPNDFIASERIRCKVWRDECDALVGPDWLNQWFSTALALPCRVAFMDAALQRPVNLDFAKKGEQVSFADGFPLLLATEASLAELNRHMSLNIDIDRFRPNLVIDGNKPWEEDQWWGLQVGEVQFQLVKPSSRCAIPTIDPQTGKKQPEVFKTLKQYRLKEDGSVYFGHNLLLRNLGRIQVGDNVSVITAGQAI